ncbi:Smr/MutS family protein [Chloroflexota bacterium]
MSTAFESLSDGFYTAFFQPDPTKRRVALDKWVEDTTPVIQAAVKAELQELVEYITEDRWTEEGWRRGAKKLRGLQGKYHIAMDIKFRPLFSNDRYEGEIPEPIIPKVEIDLHEKYVQEAIPMLEKYLQDSYDVCLEHVRIIHGKGIGVLRQAVREHLQNHRLVKSFKPADKDHGGDGVTEVELIDVITD